jgi:hypothetical protein
VRAATKPKNAFTLGVLLEIQTPALMPELVERLAAGGCVAHPIDDRVCHVVHSEARDAIEEWSELRFFVRAWQASRGVEVTLRPDAAPAAAAESG